MRRCATLLLLVLILALAACGGDDAATGGTTASGAFDLDATWSTVGGGTLDAADLAGDEVVAWFWAPW